MIAYGVLITAKFQTVAMALESKVNVRCVCLTSHNANCSFIFEGVFSKKKLHNDCL